MSVIENASNGASVGSVTITSNGGATITNISLSGTGNSNFSVATSGAITISSSATLDYETSKIYNLNAVATNSVGNSNSVSVTINITDYANPFLISQLKSQDINDTDYFGAYLDIDGDYFIVGAPNQDTSGVNAGSAYLYKKESNATITKLAKIQANDIQAGDKFGSAVAISGDYMIIGSPYNDTNGSNAGVAYLFKRNSDTHNDITQIAKLTASNAGADDNFGLSVAIDGNYAVIGAENEDSNASESGSVYIFKRGSDTNVTEIEKLTASDAQYSEYFGNSVSISNNYILVGAKGNNSAYLFKNISDTNTLELKILNASNEQTDDNFGNSVSINGNYMIVGTKFTDTSGGYSGSATDNNGESIYLFKRDTDANITEIAKIQASDTQTGDYFGEDVSISGDYIISGAHLEDTTANNAGSAYIFKRNSDTRNDVSEIKKIQANSPKKEDYFAYTVAISKNSILLGAYQEGSTDEGSAYLFDMEPIDKAYIYYPYSNFKIDEQYSNPAIYAFEAASPTSGTISFSVSGTDSDNFSFTDNNLSFVSTVSTGKPADFELPQDTNTNNDYNITITTTNANDKTNRVNFDISIIDKYFLEMAKIQASDAEASDWFGGGVNSVAEEGAVAISGNYIVVGAPYEDTNATDAGAAYLFKKQLDGTVKQIAKFQSDDVQANDSFGNSVAISGDYIVVGAIFEDTSKNYAGSAYVFKRNSDTNNDVHQIAKIQAEIPQENALFGNSVSISGDYIVVGAYKEDISTNTNAGNAYLFKRGSDTNVSQIAKFTGAPIELDALFGKSVAIDGDYIVIGAEDEDPNTAEDEGTAYIFKRNSDATNDTILVKKIQASDKTQYDYFGHSVAISGNYITVGAYWVNGETGKAYLFKRIDDSTVNELKVLTASDAQTGDRFGSSVGISLDTIIVGAYKEDTKGTDAGSAYIFKINSDTNITQEDKLQASDIEAGDNFGISVSIDKNNTAVGARSEDSTATDTGSTCIFIKDIPPPAS